MATSEEVAELRRDVEQLRTEAEGANASAEGAREQLKEELKKNGECSKSRGTQGAGRRAEHRR